MESRTQQLLEFPKVLQALARHAASEPGAAACLAIEPMDSREQCLAEAALLAQALEWTGESGWRLGEFPDLSGLFHFLENPRQVLDEDGLYALSRALDAAHEARESLKPYDAREWDELHGLVSAAPWPERTHAALRRCLDPDGRLRDQSSAELLAVRDEIRRIHQRCTKKAKDFILSHDLTRYLQDEYITISSDRYVLPLKANHKGRLQGIIHDYSQTGETCYFEPMFLVDMNNRVQELKREEREEERRVRAYLTDLLRGEFDAVSGAYAFLVRLDVLLAKCALARAMDARPLPVEPGAAPRLLEARHPLLALSGGCSPQDIELRDGDRILVVSGGNAGGKTVCLKTMGLAALMAAAALPVPAAEGSVLPLWTRIFVVLGDEQSLEDHVSTFTAQIRSLSRVWDQVDADTLFLLDEFGAGTDPSQGAALAQAVLDQLLETGATALAATHFPALKAYAMATEGVRAASVLFDPDTKRPLFRLAYDQVGASIALDVAREHGLPDAILSRAEQYMLLDGSDTTDVLERLNGLAAKRESELDAISAERVRLAEKRRKLAETFDRDRRALLEEVRSQSQAILRQWKEDRLGRKQALKKLSEAKGRLADAAPEPEPEAPAFSWEDLEPGDRVAYAAWNREGVVQEKDAKRGQVKVDLDGVAMWVKARDLGPARDAEVRDAQRAAPPARPQQAAPVLALRGSRADEAVSALERFLDDSLLRGAERLEIVHGRGTGALRREVHDFLQHFPSVETYSLAPEDRGGDGMTEVVLK